MAFFLPPQSPIARALRGRHVSPTQALNNFWIVSAAFEEPEITSAAFLPRRSRELRAQAWAGGVSNVVQTAAGPAWDFAQDDGIAIRHRDGTAVNADSRFDQQNMAYFCEIYLDSRDGDGRNLLLDFRFTGTDVAHILHAENSLATDSIRYAISGGNAVNAPNGTLPLQTWVTVGFVVRNNHVYLYSNGKAIGDVAVGATPVKNASYNDVPLFTRYDFTTSADKNDCKVTFIAFHPNQSVTDGMAKAITKDWKKALYGISANDAPYLYAVPASDGITGNLSAQEAGADTAALTGDVRIAGDLSAQETGADTAALTGDVLIAGDLSVQEAGADTLDILGSLGTEITGDLAAQEAGADTATLTGTVLISGDISVQEAGADVITILGSAPAEITGTFAAQETGSETATLTGTVRIAGTLAVQESGADILAFYESQQFTGDLAAVESGADTLGIAGFVGTVTIDGQELAITRTAYQVHGEVIAYLGTATGPLSVRIILDDDDELFPGSFEAPAVDGNTRARVMIESITAPRRDDTVSRRDGETFCVDSYQQLNNVEWALELRACNG